MSKHFEKAMLLLQQSRSELAEEQLRLALAEEPEHALAHSGLALALSNQEKYDEAGAEAEFGVHLAPDSPFTHYANAVVLFERNRYDQAAEAIQEAIRLDPEDAEHHGLLANIRFQQRDWPAALAAAEEGLALDPEEVRCINARAMALIKLGRKSEADDALDSALSKNPENAYTHANRGWAFLERSDPKKALEHFRESLRLDPELDYAKRGIVEALKARNFVYRWMLLYFLWMAKLSGVAQWTILIGLFLGYRFLRGLAATKPSLQPFLLPIFVLYIGFVLLSWLAQPFFNLLLRLDRFGRLALSRDQVIASNWVGTSLFLALVSLAAGIATGAEQGYLAAGVLGGLSLPLSATFECEPVWPRLLMSCYVGVLAMTGLVIISGSLAEPQGNLDMLAANLVTPFVLGLICSQFVANWLMSVRPKK